MAIADVKSYAHLSSADVVKFGAELDAVRKEIESTLGERDARYIRRVIALQRMCEVAARIALIVGRNRYTWALSTGMLAFAKIVENMEIGHNVMHGQWDWMNDPEIHSSTWEWDHSMPSSQWKEAHNYRHHVYANVLGMDPDEGYGLLRVARDRSWRPYHLGNPVYLVPISILYEFGMCIYHLEIGKVLAGKKDRAEFDAKLAEISRKAGRQAVKDYVIFPALTGRRWRSTLTADLTASVIRNVWEQVVTFCGHFPDGAENFTKRDLENETHCEWYLRQFLGSANFDAGPALAFMAGNLCYQIEHHLYPDLPSNRLREISHHVRKIARRYDLPYTTGSLPHQYLSVLRVIVTLALPDNFGGSLAGPDQPRSSVTVRPEGVRTSENTVRSAIGAAAGRVSKMTSTPVSSSRRSR